MPPPAPPRKIGHIIDLAPEENLLQPAMEFNTMSV